MQQMHPSLLHLLGVLVRFTLDDQLLHQLLRLHRRNLVADILILLYHSTEVIIMAPFSCDVQVFMLGSCHLLLHLAIR